MVSNAMVDDVNRAMDLLVKLGGRTQVSNVKANCGTAYWDEKLSSM